jgi:chloramphenicol-sensitive protein RarD
MLSIYIYTQKRKKILWNAIKNKKTLALSLLGGVLVGLNWLTYIWAVNNNYIIDASLGYFIYPLLTVFLGSIVFKEKFSNLKKISIVLAITGVLILTINTSSFPWVSLVLSLTFAFYSIIKKITKLEAARSLWIETTLLSIPAILFLLFFNKYLNYEKSSVDYLLLITSGFVTVFPLLLFSISAPNLKLSTLGFMQYVAPTCQFLIGLLVYKETFTFVHFISYSIVWIGLSVFLYDIYKDKKKKKYLT